MNIKIDDLSSQTIADFLEEHIDEMKSVSPPESKHALDLAGLKRNNVTFWSVWNDNELLGCGALKTLNDGHGEIKSMRTSKTARGTGVASFLLQHILKKAVAMGLNRVSIETGSAPFFEPARKLYQKFGFSICDPFADYKQDANSVFMTKSI